jgi:hypothetical protein
LSAANPYQTEHICACRHRPKSTISPEVLDDALTIEEALLPLEAILSSLVHTLEALTEYYDPHRGHRMPIVQGGEGILSFQRAQIVAYRENARFLTKKHASLLQLFDKTFAFQHQQVMLDDSTTVKVITVITLVYLSFTVVGVRPLPFVPNKAKISFQTIMGMPIFYLEEGTKTLLMSQDIWKYFVVSIPLTALSMAYWQFRVWSRRWAARPSHDTADCGKARLLKSRRLNFKAVV